MHEAHVFSAIYLTALNLFTFFAYGWDKFCAKRGIWRTPEKRLLLLALLGGSLGAYAGMWLFRHKTRHLTFRLALPVILAAQLIALIYLHMP